MKAKEVKRMANQSIKSRGISLFLGTVLFLFCKSIFKQTETLFKIEALLPVLLISLVFIVLERPLNYGFTAMYVNKRNGEEVRFFDFFKLGFENFVRAWSITLNLIPKYIVPIICIVISSVLIFAPLYKSLDKIKELWDTQSYTSAENMISTTITFEEGIEYVEGDLFPTEIIETQNVSDTYLNVDFILGFVMNVLSVIVIETLTIIISLILYVIAFGLIIILSYKYRYCYTNAIMNTHLTAKEVVEKTGDIMSGNKFKAFTLDFSFILRFIFFGIVNFIVITALSGIPQILNILIQSLVSALCVTKYYMSHVVFFEEKC